MAIKGANKASAPQNVSVPLTIRDEAVPSSAGKQPDVGRSAATPVVVDESVLQTPIFSPKGKSMFFRRSVLVISPAVLCFLCLSLQYLNLFE